MNLLAEALVWLLTSAICSTFYKKLLLHKSNCKWISVTVSQANAIYNLVHEYWQFLFMLLWKINLPSGSICFSCSTWSHLSLQVRALSAVSHLQEGVWSNPRQNWPWFICRERDCAVPLWADSKDRHKDSKCSYQKCLSASNKYGSAISYSFFFINALPFSW